MATTTNANLPKPILLTTVQQTLRDEIENELEELKNKIHTYARVSPDDIRKLGAKAASLHKSLQDAGVAVQHHKYMIENRGVPPSNPNFYEHIHPIEDLLKFIADPSANYDPEDQTIGHEFDFEVYSRRWQHNDTYKLQRTNRGWSVSSLAPQPVATAKDGRVGGKLGTGLFQLLDHDSINYPEELPGYLEWLWQRAAEEGLVHDKLQEALTMLANWVSLVERNTPKGIFAGYK